MRRTPFVSKYIPPGIRKRLTRGTVFITLLATVAVASLAMQTTWNLAYKQTLDKLDSVTALKQAELETFRSRLRTDLAKTKTERIIPQQLKRIDLNKTIHATEKGDAHRVIEQRLKEITALSPHIDEIF